MGRVALYVRVSTQDQSLGQQKTPLEGYCKDNGLEYDLFEDVISGAKESRPQLDLMMQGIRSKKYDTVIIYKLDRLGRSLKHLIQLVEEFNNKNIKFICLNPSLDTTTAQGRFFIQIIGAVAELEREMIIERTREKLKHLKEVEGKTLGRPTGSKDKKRRKRSGYYQRYTKQSTP